MSWFIVDFEGKDKNAWWTLQQSLTRKINGPMDNVARILLAYYAKGLGGIHQRLQQYQRFALLSHIPCNNNGRGTKQMKFILVATDCFYRWVEA